MKFWSVKPVKLVLFCHLNLTLSTSIYSYSGSQSKDGQVLHSIFVDYIEGMRLFLESEGDKDSPTLQEIRLHYAGFIHRLIRSISRKESRIILFICHCKSLQAHGSGKCWLFVYLSLLYAKFILGTDDMLDWYSYKQYQQ